MFDDLAELAGLAAGSRILEIGCGTGQATSALAERGYRVLAVELGAEMAGVARRNLSRFPHVEVVQGAFEEWPLPETPFDLVFAATAFHWLDPAVRAVKAADALRHGGTLAVVETHHVLGGTVEFFADSQDCYERFDPATQPGLRLTGAETIPEDDGEFTATGRYAPTVVRSYEWDQAYTTAQYVDVLLTYSGHRALPDANRRGLLDSIRGLIDTRYGGRIVKRYLTRLRVARRIT